MVAAEASLCLSALLVFVQSCGLQLERTTTALSRSAHLQPAAPSTAGTALQVAAKAARANARCVPYFSFVPRRRLAAAGRRGRFSAPGLVLFGGALFMLFGLSLEKFHEARAELCQAVGGVSDGTVSRGERGPRGTLRALGPTPARGTATTRGETARATTQADARRRTATCQCARVRG